MGEEIRYSSGFSSISNECPNSVGPRAISLEFVDADYASVFETLANLGD